MLQIKDGVDLRGLKPETVIALVVAETVYRKHGLDCVVTSCARAPDAGLGVQAEGRRSLHESGFAVDLRWPASGADAVVADLRLALRGQYDVVPEPDAPGGAHVHVEFDPK